MIKTIELLANGKYSEAHERLDGVFSQKKSDLTDYVRLKLQLFFIERRLYEAMQFFKEHEVSLPNEQRVELHMRILLNWYKYEEAEEYYEKNKISDLLYLRGICLFYEKRYNDAKDVLKECINVNQNYGPALYYQILSFYLDSCLFTEKKDSREVLKCMEIINQLFDSENQSDNYILKTNPHFYLIKAFVGTDKITREKCLEKFFEESQNFKVFDNIIKYSHCLGYKPDDLFCFFEQHWRKYDDNNYFASIINQELDKKIKRQYIKIIYWSLLISSQIMVKDETEIQSLCHYTSSDTFLKMVNGEFKVAMISLSDVNDKIEGEVLFEILKNNGFSQRINCDYKSKYVALQTSYTRNKDSLTMFRLYGKKDGKEDTGVCLTFDNSFFQMDSRDLGFPELTGDNNSSSRNIRRPLFWVLYYDSVKNRFFYYPAKDELIPYIVELNRRKPKWNSQYDGDKKKITENRLLYLFKSLFLSINQIPAKQQTKKAIALRLLERIRYFIKLDSFSEEKECRMLELQLPAEADVIPNTFVLKKDYRGINDTSGLTEIILGPKITNLKLIREFVMHEMDMSKTAPLIRLSTAPLL